MSLRKTAKVDSPYATFVKGPFEWRVLKVNAPKKGWEVPFATWFVAAKSPYTGDRWEYGDTYITDILKVTPERVQATPEFIEYFGW
jgi:hypothetical protein